MKKYLVLMVGCVLPLIALAGMQATGNMPPQPVYSGPATSPGEHPTLQPLDAIENTPAMAAVRVGLKQAIASGDCARIKRVENRIQELYLAQQQPPAKPADLKPLNGQGQSQIPFGPNPDVIITGPVVYASAADYSMDGSIYAAAALPDTTVRVWKSRDHGATWAELNGVRYGPGFLPRVQLVVTQGDSAAVNLFFLVPDNNGDAYIVRFDTAGANWQDWPVLADTTTLNDIAFTTDNYALYPYLYGVVYNSNNSTNTNCEVVRSVDYGHTWAVTRTFYGVFNAAYEFGAGTWQYFACGNGGSRGTVGALSNHSYGDPAYWHEHDVRPDTFDVGVMSMSPEFTMPETSAVTWLAYGHYNSSTGHDNIVVHYTTDGMATWSSPQIINSEATASDWASTLQNYRAVGNTYMDLCYVSYNPSAHPYWRLFLRFSEASTPGTWSDTLRIGADNAVQMWGWDPVEVYSPGAPGSGASVVYVQWDTLTSNTSYMVWNGPWNGTAVTEAPRALPLAGEFGLAPNPAARSVRFGWTGVARSVAVYDRSGKLVCKFDRPSGSALVWNRTDGSGRAVSAGVYLVKLETNLGTTARTLVVR